MTSNQAQEAITADDLTKATKVASWLMWSKKYALALTVITILPIALYWQTVTFGYILDDKIVITDNAYTQEGFAGIWDIMTTESFQGYFGERKNLVQGNRYRPLSIMTFAVENGLWGNKPGISHSINILLYILTGWLLLRVLTNILPTSDRQVRYLSFAVATTLLYLSHPLHIEAVANIKGRDEIMAMLISLWCLWLSIRYHHQPGFVRLMSIGVVFFLGLLAKENTITFLAVIPLTLWCFKRSTAACLTKVTLTLLASTAIYLALRFTMAGVPSFSQEITDVMNNPFYGMTIGERTATTFYTFFKYVQLLVIPYPLSHDYYPYAIPKVGWDDVRAIVALITHVVAALWSLWAIPRRSIPAYTILFYLLTFSIVSNVVINVGTFMNERFVYMASLGYAILLAYLLVDRLPQWAGKVGHKVGFGLFVVIMLLYSVITIDRVPAWASALALNESAVVVSPGSARANSFMATALFNDFRAAPDKRQALPLLDEAEVYADRALQILPDYGNGNTMRLGIASERYKVDYQISPLLEDFERVIMVRPGIPFITEFMDYVIDRGAHTSELISFYDRIGNRFITEQNNPKAAIYYLEHGSKIDRSNSRLNQSLANAYQLSGQPAKANEYLNRIR